MVINDFNGTTNAFDRPMWKLHSKVEFIVKLCYWRRNIAYYTLGTGLYRKESF